MNTENCWFCNTPLDGDVALYNHHVVHSDCMELGWVPVAIITDERVARFVKLEADNGNDWVQEDLDEIFSHEPIDKLKAENVYIMGMGETKELDSFYVTMQPTVTIKEKIAVISLGDGWNIIPVDSFVDMNNGQHYIHGSIF